MVASSGCRWSRSPTAPEVFSYNLVELEDLGARAFAGIAEAVQVRAAYRKNIKQAVLEHFAKRLTRVGIPANRSL